MPNHNFPTNFVGRDGQLSRIVQRVATLNQVLDIIRQVAPPELAPLCLGVAWHGSELLVALPFSAAAVRLRMAAPAMIEALHKAGWHATAIQKLNPVRTRTGGFFRSSSNRGRSRLARSR